MRKQIITGILTAAMVSMAATPVMAKDFSGGRTRVDVSVTTSSTDDTAAYDVTVPTVLALTVDAAGDAPKVIIGSSDGQLTEDSSVGSLVFKNNSKETKNGVTKDLGVALKTVHISQAENSDWTIVEDASKVADPYSMSFAFGDKGEVKAQQIEGLPYSIAIFKDFVMGKNSSEKELKVRAGVSGTKEGYADKDAAAAFTMEYYFNTITDAEYAAN